MNDTESDIDKIDDTNKMTDIKKMSWNQNELTDQISMISDIDKMCQNRQNE